MQEETIGEAVERAYRAAMGEAIANGFRLLQSDDGSATRTIYEEDAARIEGHVEGSIAAVLGSRLASLRVTLNRQVSRSPGDYPGSQRTYLEAKVSYTPATDEAA